MVHPIERESFEILAGRVDLSHLEPGPRAVLARVIHASADLEFATSMHVPPDAVAAGVAAVRAGAPVIVDVQMVAAGIAGPTVCRLADAQADPSGYPTRSAQAVRLAAADHPQGAVWVIGCAPTALQELVSLVDGGAVCPAVIIGLPVGFVGAAESKAATRRLAVPTITNVGEKGGSAAAAAAYNALVRLAT